MRRDKEAKRTIRILIVAALVLPAAAMVLTPSDAAVRWSVHPELGAAFAERWSWGSRQAGGDGWVGYAVARWAEPDQHFVSGSVIVFGDGGMRMRGEPLDAVLGAAAAVPEGLAAVNEQRPGTVRRPLAVLIGFAGGQVDDVAVSDLELPVDLKGRPLAWIGPASADDSLRLARELFGRSERKRAREDLVELAGFHDRPAALDFLAGVLGSETDVSVREEAVEALGELATPAARAKLREVLRHDPHVALQEEALDALAQLGGAEALEVLVETAREHPKPAIREEAIDHLAEIGATDRVLAVLEEILYRDPSPALQEEALDALADLPGDAGLDLLIEAARHHPSPAIREEAVDHLAEKASDRVAAALEDVVYLDDHLGVREEALEALGELPGGGGLAILVTVARTHPDKATRQEAVEVLGDLGESDERARRALRMLGSE